ncbi:MAG: hypothetical protein JXA46_16300 [Dehalococcoidales bacterium]|nr:hypothetical protein [Dehalococcoidales bacterium]
MSANNKNQVLVTKITMPRLPLDWTARPRISGRLANALRYRLVLVSAPAGYGKTTLVNETLSILKKPCGWVSLDSGDNIPATFWTYFIAAIQSISPAACQPVLNALQSMQPPPSDWVLKSVINSLSEIDDDFVIVLDDYYTLESHDIHEAVSYLVDHLPPQAHLVITSRIDPPLPLARWRVGAILSEIRAADLGFTLEETAVFVKKITGLTLEAGDLAALEDRTEGWIAGLKMAALSLKGKKDASGYVQALSRSNRYILDYLAEEVLGRQSPELSGFLLETSILERLSAPLCDAVTDRSDSQLWLEKLEIANLFINALDDERRWYRYHQLFAAVLRNQLAKTAPKKTDLLHRRASRWYEREGFTREAVDHALLSHDEQRAALLVENAAPDMLGRHQTGALLGYSAILPGKIIEARPWLCICFAWAALITNSPETLAIMMERAAAAITVKEGGPAQGSRTDPRRIRGHMLSLQSFIAQAQGETGRAIRLSEEADRELPGNALDDLLARAVNSLNLADCYKKTGDISRAVPYLENLVKAGRKVGYHYAVLSALASMAEIEIQLASPDRVAALCRECIEYGRRYGGACPLPSTAPAYICLGYLQYLQNKQDSVAEYLIKGIELGEASFNQEPVLKGNLFMAELLQAQGDEAGAEERFQRAAGIGPWVFVPLEMRQISARRARMQVRRGDLKAALDWAAQQEPSLHLSGLPEYEQEYPYLTLVSILVADGRCGEIPGYLDKLILNAERQERKATVIEALVLKARALECLGKPDKAIETLEAALALAEPCGYARLFLDQGTGVARILSKVASHGRSAGYARKLMGMIMPSLQRQDAKAEGPAILPGMVEALSDREIEILKLIASGKSNSEIASVLFLAVGTVKKHSSNIFGKLGVGNRTGAVARARELGLIK